MDDPSDQTFQFNENRLKFVAQLTIRGYLTWDQFQSSATHMQRQDSLALDENTQKHIDVFTEPPLALI